FAFVVYFSLGGFRGLVSVLVHSEQPEFDYSRPHDEIRERNPLVLPGGRYSPPDCEPRHHTAIVWGNSTFNRAKLLNVGVREALRDEDWGCIFLHDVDLLPENDHNTYTCHNQFPTHLSVAMDKFRYRLPYPQYFGGVSAVTPEQYMKMNGFPNSYWGWGGEDDDIAARVRLSGMKILLSKELQPLYTNLTVDIGDDPRLPQRKATPPMPKREVKGDELPPLVPWSKHGSKRRGDIPFAAKHDLKGEGQYVKVGVVTAVTTAKPKADKVDHAQSKTVHQT
ncbi:unnamed protein product, partial [Coregonus sp. 'balchen']